MKAFRLQSALPSAVIAAAMLFGSTQARAGYVALPTIAEHENGRSLAHSPLMSLAELGASTGVCDTSEASPLHPDGEDLPLPMEPASPSRKLPHGAFTFAYGGSSSSSSSSAPSGGPSGSVAGFSSCPQIPPLELSSLLPPHKGDAHPFSLADSLFRPPRHS